MADPVSGTVLAKVVDVLFGAIGREISYVRNYTENVDKLRNEVGKLKDMKGRVEQRIGVAEGKGEKLLHGVEDWVKMAIVEISEAEEFLQEEANAKKNCFNLRLCVNLCSLHHYSKMATKKAPSVLQHHENGQIYESSVSVSGPTPGLLSLYEPKNLEDIDTQKQTMGKIIDALRDESIQIIGIYGLGGVGKTTLANEVANTVRNLFYDVVFILVSQTVKYEDLRNNVKEAAQKIMNGKEILIILDDVWEKLELDQMGIPRLTNNKNCKILLTSRSIDVCEAMDAQSQICVDPLKEKESWVLFKRVVGERVQTDSKLNSIATRVVEECGGLPLVIQAVGMALKNKTFDIWEAVLERLKDHAPSTINPAIKKAFTQLKLSYDYLENEEAKACFLLCSMFPEDVWIPLESLVYYMVGLGKFKSLGSIHDARGRVRIVVGILKSSFLLLETDGRGTKMHDVVRDVALEIASKEENNFFVKAGIGSTEWPRDRNDLTYTAISLMGNGIRKVPDCDLGCRQLETLLVQKNSISSTISDAFIQGMKEVKVFDMENNQISSLPHSFSSLTNLRMLNLGRNRSFKGIDVVAELKGLEILILRETSIEEIPEQFGELAFLRLLDVSGCDSLSSIAPGVISNLHGLEELDLEQNGKWGRSYDNLMELSSLNKLTSLYLSIESDHFPNDVCWADLKAFSIQVESTNTSNLHRDLMMAGVTSSRRTLYFRECDLKVPLARGIMKLIEVTTHLSFHSVPNLIDFMQSLKGGVFNNLESLVVNGCDLSCLVDTNDWGRWQVFRSLETLTIAFSHELSEICRGALSKNHFSKLQQLRVLECNKLQNVVSSNMIHVAGKIKILSARCCESVRCIFESEGIGGEGEETFLSRLERLHLAYLPALEVIWNYPNKFVSLCNLVIFKVVRADKMRKFFPMCVAQGLVNLQMLELERCDGLEEVIWDEDEETVRGEIKENIVFPCLQTIEFRELPKLESFCSGDYNIEYPSLVSVQVWSCYKMEKWGFGTQHAPKLKYVNVRKWEGPYDMNDIITRGIVEEHEADG